MADDDRAIVVGIKVYPAFDVSEDQRLDGPENDANAFYDWLISPTGGNVPAVNPNDPNDKTAVLIRSSDFNPPFASVDAAAPTMQEFLREVERLQDISTANIKAQKGPRVGRRLYLYLSGHGFSPRSGQTALLGANATPQRVGPPYHILGEYTARWFQNAGCFEEIVLFMDCCREQSFAPALNEAFGPVDAGKDADQVRFLYGFASEEKRLTREHQMPDGKVHGVFTWTLLQALSGPTPKAASPNGQITAASLMSYMYNNMRHFLTDDDTSNGDVSPEPFMGCDEKYRDTFVLAAAQAPQFLVMINLPPGSKGRTVQILDNGFQIVKSTKANGLIWQVNLNRGLYLVQILGTAAQQQVEVAGVGEVNVNF
jgi:uncharacterized caspase-like protein